MATNSVKIPVTKISRSNRNGRTRVERQRFAEDLDIALRRIARTAEAQSIASYDPWQALAYWQTAVVKIARWFDQSQEGIQFDPWDYVEEGERAAMKLVLDLRSQWMTRKSNPEKILELLVVDDESLQVIPTEISMENAVAVLKDGRRVQLIGPGMPHTGKIPGTSFGVFHLKEEAGQYEEIITLLDRIRDRVKRQLDGD